MNTKRFTLIFLALIGLLLLSGCATASTSGSSWPGLAADADAAYLADGALIYAVRLRDGAELWRYPQKAEAKTAFYATPVLLGDGRLVIGSAGTDHCLYVIDTTKVAADTKTPEATCFFAAAKDRWIAAPLVVGDTVYAPNNDGTLYHYSEARHRKDGRWLQQDDLTPELIAALPSGWPPPFPDCNVMRVDLAAPAGSSPAATPTSSAPEGR